MDAAYSQNIKYLIQAVPIDWKNYAIVLHCINSSHSMTLIDQHHFNATLAQADWNQGDKCVFIYKYHANTYTIQYSIEGSMLQWVLNNGAQDFTNAMPMDELKKIDFSKIDWKNPALDYYNIRLGNDINKPISIPNFAESNPQHYFGGPPMRGVFLQHMNPFESDNLMGPGSFGIPNSMKVRHDPTVFGIPDNDEWMPHMPQNPMRNPNGPFNPGMGYFPRVNPDDMFPGGGFGYS